MSDADIYKVAAVIRQENHAKPNALRAALGAVLIMAQVGIPVSAAATAPMATAYYGHAIKSRREEGTMLRLERDPAFYGGRPMLPGTGLPAWVLAEMLQSGETITDLLEAYPFLTRALLESYFTFLTTTHPEQLGAPIDPWSL